MDSPVPVGVTVQNGVIVHEVMRSVSPGTIVPVPNYHPGELVRYEGVTYKLTPGQEIMFSGGGTLWGETEDKLYWMDIRGSNESGYALLCSGTYKMKVE